MKKLNKIITIDSCYYCPCATYVDDEWEEYCVCDELDKIVYTWEDIPEDCPLETLASHSEANRFNKEE